MADWSIIALFYAVLDVNYSGRNKNNKIVFRA